MLSQVHQLMFKDKKSIKIKEKCISSNLNYHYKLINDLDATI